MKDRLEQCRKIALGIKECNLKISEIKSSCGYKGPQFGGSGFGGNRINAAERYVEDVEKFEDKKQKLYSQLNEKWADLKIIFDESNLTAEEIKLLYLRFYKGFSWKKCSKMMFWNEGRTFGTFRKILLKMS